MNSLVCPICFVICTVFRASKIHFNIIINKMQKEAKILYNAVANVIAQQKEIKGVKYTEICYENDVATSTYDDIINSKTKASFYNIAKIIRGLGLSFEEFGKLLDKELDGNFEFFE